MRIVSRALIGPTLVLLFGTIAISPMINPNFIISHDGLFHLHRLVEFDECLRNGAFLPRWAPDLIFGYGYPIFNFYPYLSYYPAWLFHLLSLDFDESIKAAFVLYSLLSGLTIYFFVKDAFGEKPALVAAIAYIYAPYQLYNSLVRGTLSEVFALALFPLVLWAFHRLVLTGKRRYIVLSSLSYAAFLLIHNIASMILTPLLFLYTGSLWLARKRKVPFWLPSLTMMLAFGISSFFLVPAFFEMRYVQIERDISGHADYHLHFLSLKELLSPPGKAVVRLLCPPDYRGLGICHLALAIIAIIGVKRLRPKGERLFTYISFLVVAGSAFAAMNQSVWLWERLPFIAHVQYPWRFLGPASFSLSILAGAAVKLFPDRNASLSPALFAASTMIVGIIALSFPLLYPHYYPQAFDELTLADVIALERRTGHLGTTSFSEFLPIWVEEVPKGSPMEEMYRDGAQIERFDSSSLPEGGLIEEANYGFNFAEIELLSPRPFRAVFNVFYFPGWRAYINGRETTITPTYPLGLISFDVPGGESTISLRFGDTRLRAVSKAISAISVSALTLLVFLTKGPNLSAFDESIISQPLSGAQAGILASLALALFLFKIGYVDRYDTPFKREGFDGMRVDGMEVHLQVDFGEELVLLGYDLHPKVVRGGEIVQLNLYWKQKRKLEVRPRVFIKLLDERGTRLYSETHGWVPKHCPPEIWGMEMYTKDAYQIHLPSDIPPGKYSVNVLLVNEKRGLSRGVILDYVKVPLPQVNVSRIKNLLEVTLGDSISLIGYDLDTLVKAGEELNLTLYWQCERPMDEDYTVFVHLLDEEGRIIAQHDCQPRFGNYPTSIWDSGEVIPDEHHLSIGSETPSGEYRLIVGMYLLATMERLPAFEGGRRLPMDAITLGYVKIFAKEYGR